ncbi:MAG: hypothetical protein AUH79_01145 [Betaproteobacteria bacterium 13_1_40CM_4_64_4]|nr:MAG: hypothetical protein AUH79_01145 [Betaproteobacteria bacterium 13_1_40CM_4_64_4]
MKVFLIAFAALVLAALATIAAVSFARNTPTEKLMREDRAVTGFHRLEIDGQIDVTLAQGAAEGVKSATARFSSKRRDSAGDGCGSRDATAATHPASPSTCARSTESGSPER